MNSQNYNLKWMHFIKKVFVLILGTAILTFGLTYIHGPSSITEGGVLGMTLLLANTIALPLWFTAPILDGICYYFGYQQLGKGFIGMSIIATSSMTVFYGL